MKYVRVLVCGKKDIDVKPRSCEPNPRDTENKSNVNVIHYASNSYIHIIMHIYVHNYVNYV